MQFHVLLEEVRGMVLPLQKLWGLQREDSGIISTHCNSKPGQ